MRFLKEIKEETSHRSKIRNLLVLACRMLAFGALILAFAYPFFQNSEDTIMGRKATSIFVDNSFSMQSKAEDVILLEKAKVAAREIIQAHNDDDAIQILTHDLEGRHQRWTDKEEALSLLDEIRISSASQNIETIAQRQKQLFRQVSDYVHHAYWISDFQSQMMEEYSDTDTTYMLSVVPISHIQDNNISLDSAWLPAPVATANENNPVLVKVTNRGNGRVENIRLAVEYQGQNKPLSVLNLEPGASKVDTFSMPARSLGWQSAKFQLTDHPITFDDTYHIAFEIPDELKILVINERGVNSALQSALNSMEEVSWTSSSASGVAYNTFSEYDLIVLQEVPTISSGMITELSGYQKAGGNILFFPHPTGNVDSYNSLFSQLNGPRLEGPKDVSREVSRINSEEFIFNDVFFNISQNIRLPKSERSFEMTRMGSGFAEKLLTYRDGGTYLGKFRQEDGRLYVVHAPLNKVYNSLTQNAEIFIPMVYKMALSKSTRSPNSYTLGKDDWVEMPALGLKKEETLSIVGSEEFIPGVQNDGGKTLLNVSDQISQSGIYQVLKSGQEVGLLAFNYNRRESKMSFAPVNEESIASWHPNAQILDADEQVQLASFLKEEREGKSYWRTLLILSLIFLAFEQLLLRFWKA